MPMHLQSRLLHRSRNVSICDVLCRPRCRDCGGEEVSMRGGELFCENYGDRVKIGSPGDALLAPVDSFEFGT